MPTPLNKNKARLEILKKIGGYYVVRYLNYGEKRIIPKGSKNYTTIIGNLKGKGNGHFKKYANRSSQGSLKNSKYVVLNGDGTRTGGPKGK